MNRYILDFRFQILILRISKQLPKLERNPIESNLSWIDWTESEQIPDSRFQKAHRETPFPKQIPDSRFSPLPSLTFPIMWFCSHSPHIRFQIPSKPLELSRKIPDSRNPSGPRTIPISHSRFHIPNEISEVFDVRLSDLREICFASSCFGNFKISHSNEQIPENNFLCPSLHLAPTHTRPSACG